MDLWRHGVFTADLHVRTILYSTANGGKGRISICALFGISAMAVIESSTCCLHLAVEHTLVAKMAYARERILQSHADGVVGDVVVYESFIS